MKHLLDLQLFAELDTIITANADKFTGSNIKDQFTEISTKLGELGFEVLLNNKAEAEFVPSSRVHAVTAQRDGFKTKLDELNVQLEGLKKSAGTDDLKAEYEKMIQQNTSLIKELDTVKINTEFLIEAKDAADPKDLLMFINMEKISFDKSGNVLGVKAEVERLRKEKPYLFTTGKVIKAGVDRDGEDDKGTVSGMNSMIRRAAGRK